MGMSEHDYEQYMRGGFENKIKLLNTCIEQLETDIELQGNTVAEADPQQPPATLPASSKVFLISDEPQQP
jgi:hypothetical protein